MKYATRTNYIIHQIHEHIYVAKIKTKVLEKVAVQEKKELKDRCAPCPCREERRASD